MKIYIINNWILFVYVFVSGNSTIKYDRTKTDTGEQVEYTKALERTILKELGKIAP
jgi:hypothetical protein